MGLWLEVPHVWRSKPFTPIHWLWENVRAEGQALELLSNVLWHFSGSVNIEVLGVWCAQKSGKLLPALSPCHHHPKVALYISSTWLFLGCISHHKLVNIGQGSMNSSHKLNLRRLKNPKPIWAEIQVLWICTQSRSSSVVLSSCIWP